MKYFASKKILVSRDHLGLKQHTCIHNIFPTSLYIRQQRVFSGKLKLKIKWIKLKLYTVVQMTKINCSIN